jgi:hypothetical protein
MILICKVNSKSELVQVELVNDAEIDMSLLDESEYVFRTDSDETCNALLNDYSKCAVVLDASTKTVKEVSFASPVDGATSDYHNRFIPDEDWVKRVRPALFRAATTTNLFNA